MDLINTTSLAAALRVAVLGERERVAHLIAKATFRFPGGGAPSAALEHQDVVPLFDAPEPWGALPRDDLPRDDDAFEVVSLGVAHAPGGGAATAMSVALTVGQVRRELAVFGDRHWLDDGETIPEPARFSTMPLTYERAFGGACDVLVDRDAVVRVADVNNPVGRGFDPRPDALAAAHAFGMAEGYPVFDAPRTLPNIEDPAALIRRRDDAPLPVGFAPLPTDSALHVSRSVDLVEREEGPAIAPGPGALHQASPQWVIAPPGPGTTITLEGMTPEGRLSFVLPALDVQADCIVGDTEGALRLAPHMLVLLPEQRRFTMLFRLLLLFDFADGDERAMCLRIGQGRAAAIGAR